METIVIDVGCAKHGDDESIPYLVKEFSPSFLYGFDPEDEEEVYKLDKTLVDVRPWVAWGYNGTIGFEENGLRGRVNETSGTQVRCFALADFIGSISLDAEVVLKIDAEGAEYTLLPYLNATYADRRLRLALVEWHCPECGTGGCFSHDDRCEKCDAHLPGKRSSIEASMGCEMRQWNR